jgi:thiol-disulfide isomerase/thioredoxin
MSVFACNTLLFFLALPSLSSPFSFGLQKEDKPLYSGLDPGLTLVNISDFKSIVHGSKSAWMVEFFSSWCGHCIHFAPTFRHLAKDVQGWSNVISVAAIDCAKDEVTDNTRIVKRFSSRQIALVKINDITIKISEYAHLPQLRHHGIPQPQVLPAQRGPERRRVAETIARVRGQGHQVGHA